MTRKQSSGQILHVNTLMEQGSCNPNEIRLKKERKMQCGRRENTYRLLTWPTTTKTYNLAMRDSSGRPYGNSTSQNSPSGQEVKNLSARPFPCAVFQESDSLPRSLTRLHFQDSLCGSHIHTAWEVGPHVGRGQQLSVLTGQASVCAWAPSKSRSITCLRNSREGPDERGERFVV